jgi:hypothetical protein
VNFLNNKYVRAVTAVLILQGIVFYAIALRAESAPPASPLAAFPTDIAGW